MKLKTYALSFKNISYFLHFGHLPEEQTLGQRIFIDVNINVNPQNFTCSDDLHTVFDYCFISEITERVVHEKKYKLLEHLAKRIAEDLFLNEPEPKSLEEITISIRKPSVPIPQILDYAEVSLTFSANE